VAVINEDERAWHVGDKVNMKPYRFYWIYSHHQNCLSCGLELGKKHPPLRIPMLT